MWTRRELKTRAKLSFRRNYLNMAAVAVIFMLIMNAESYYNSFTGQAGESSAVSSVSSIGSMTDSSSISHYSGLFSNSHTLSDEYFSSEEETESAQESSSATGESVQGTESGEAGVVDWGNLTYDQLMTMSNEEIMASYEAYMAKKFDPANIKAAMPMTLFWFLFMVFVSKAVEVGCCAFFVKNTEERVPMRTVLSGFRVSYLRNVLTLFIRDVKVFLWTLLFFIPGIMKSLEYRMVPYLLAEYPGMTRKEAFYYSKKLMQGEKWDALVLDFSFILWAFLDALTGGIAGILWVNPYQMATNAELYKKLKEIKGMNL